MRHEPVEIAIERLPSSDTLTLPPEMTAGQTGMSPLPGRSRAQTRPGECGPRSAQEHSGSRQPAPEKQGPPKSRNRITFAIGAYVDDQPCDCRRTQTDHVDHPQGGQ